jgi:periplasmic protein TonB
VNDPVDRLIDERERMDRGFSAGIFLSLAAHLLLVGASVAAPLLRVSQPPLRVQEGFAVPMPPGGGGSPKAAPAAGVEAPAPEPAAPPAAPLPKVLRPPKPEPAHKKGLPPPDAKKSKPKPEKSAEPQTAYDPSKDPTPRRAQAGSGTPGGTGTATPGLEFGPPGPGVPGGTDWLGDWYLAGVQRKIWLLWTQQIKSGFSQPIAVRFTVQADGSVSDVEIVQTSGAALLDLAAQRAVFSAAPFGPLPRNYGTNRYTIQAVFKPTGP